MKRYIIEDAKCGITEGGIACGPVDGSVVVTIQFKEGDKTQWLSMVEVQGIPNVFLFDRDVHDELLKEDYDDEKFINYMNAHAITEFNGIQFTDDYSDVFTCFAEEPENSAIPLVRYLITLVRCDMDDVKGLIAMAREQFVDELEIPISDVEADFFEEYEAEGEGDEE